MVRRTNRRRRVCISFALAALIGFLLQGASLAQELQVFSAPGQQPSPEQMKLIMEAQKRAGQPGGPPGAQPTPDAKPVDKDKKPEGEADKKKEEEEKTVKRPDKPPRTPDPREFDVKLDETGRVPPFSFIGQPWPDVMQWLASLSNASLDWQKLPGDYLNLVTDRSYTLDEVRDLINQALHARGFASIQSGEVLTVFKIEELDPSLVPHVGEEELYDRKRYDFVKVTFQLPSAMEVDKAKDDVKQVLSPHAKIFPLVTTKRLLVMDSVANLRTVSELLNQERLVQDGRIVPKEFVLRHARPQQVIEILYVILGVDPKAKPAQTDPQAMQQQMQMMQEMRGRGQDVAQLMPKTEAPKVFLAYNRQRNSVLANAPPEQMRIIEQTIAYLDVPFGGQSFAPAAGVTELAPGRTDLRVTKKYTLATLDPENFVTTLEEIGGLSPFAEFRVDKKSKTLFAIASEADHLKIDSLLDQFDGTGRQFEVIWLRRLPALAVAQTIYNLMAGQTEEEDDSDRNRFWSPWDYRGREEDEEKPVQGFGVDADIENNRLLLWANETEMKRVRDLLVKLGEIPGGERGSRPVRFIQPGDDNATAEMLEQLRDAWNASGGNELIIKAPAKPKTAPVQEETKDNDTTEETTKPANDRAANVGPSPRIAARFVQLDAGTAAENGAEAEPSAETAEVSAESSDEAAPVTITVTEDGRLMLSSSDTAALDRLEDLIAQLSPPQRRFKVYPLKHIPAVHMYLDLKDYFEEDLKDESGGYIRDWFGFRVPTGSQDKSTGLSKPRKLMITYDEPSNSVLVSNASPSQLAEIEQLIETFDKPAPKDSMEIRDTAAVKIQYSRASVIAAAVKEVYRDLLSSRDKEFDRNGDQRERGRQSERVTVINYGGSSGDDDSDGRSGIKAGFEGALSIGADDVSNVIIVSAQRGIFKDVVQMIKELDDESKPQTTIRVHRVNGGVTAQALEQALDNAVGQPWLGNRPEQAGNRSSDRGGRGDGDRRRDRDRRRNRDND
jgi:type II secretory pathway component GspD/PulD (secretin)